MKILPLRYLVLLPLLMLLSFAPATAQKNNAKAPVNITVSIADAEADNNLILYKAGKKLSIEDFKGKTDEHSDGVAATYSGISLEMQGLSKNGVMNITVKLTVYFDKTKSWMKRDGKTERVLAHEQIHFDLTAMKACALAKALREESYTLQNVQQKIRQLQEQHTQELNKLQQAYDKETKHGTIADKQAEWAARVAKELASNSCM
jgi:DNA polymerase elongation subunit (family B)